MKTNSQAQLFAGVGILLGILALATPLESGDALEFWRSAFAAKPAPAMEPHSISHLRVALGEKLFQDTRLSGDGTRACISCHDPSLGFGDGLARARTTPGRSTKLRNTPTLYGLRRATVFNWDGSATSLEQQVLGPIQSRAELGANFPDILARLGQDKSMVQAFASALPRTPKISQTTITRVLADYVRTLEAPKTKFDAWVEGDDTALTTRQRLGLRLFVGKGGCVACHAGPRLTDEAFHDIGLPDNQVFNGKDVAGKRGVRAFKTPTLRAVSKTAPYMHNGSIKSLADVVDHYSDGIVPRRGVSGIMRATLAFTQNEKDALIAFLKTL